MSHFEGKSLIKVVNQMVQNRYPSETYGEKPLERTANRFLSVRIVSQ